jgi:two-component system, cell cycle response regulator
MVAERLRRAVATEPFPVHKGAKRIEVTTSIGLSTLEIKGEEVADVLKRADTALYRAKHDGRNRVVTQPEANGSPRLPEASGGRR